jgi:hypothetical protein
MLDRAMDTRGPDVYTFIEEARQLARGVTDDRNVYTRRVRHRGESSRGGDH